MQEQNAIEKQMQSFGKDLFMLAILAVRRQSCKHYRIDVDIETGRVVCVDCGLTVKEGEN